MVGAKAAKAITIAALTAIPAVGLLSSGPAFASVPGCTNTETPSAVLPLPSFNLSVICLINQQRAAFHLKPLRRNERLNAAAYIYTTSLLSGEFFTHHGGLTGDNNTSTVIGRDKFIGYIPPGKRWVVGENLREAPIPTDTPNGVVTAWMNSPEHRAWILKPKIEDIGVDTEHGIADAFPVDTGVTIAAEFGFRRFPHRR
jgi:uncharacterized protein YkwD